MKSTLVVSILMLAIQIAYGQVDTGTVTGVVRDSSGSVVLDAKITVRNLGTGLGAGTLYRSRRHLRLTPFASR